MSKPVPQKEASSTDPITAIALTVVDKQGRAWLMVEGLTEKLVLVEDVLYESGFLPHVVEVGSILLVDYVRAEKNPFVTKVHMVDDIEASDPIVFTEGNTYAVRALLGKLGTVELYTVADANNGEFLRYVILKTNPETNHLSSELLDDFSLAEAKVRLGEVFEATGGNIIAEQAA